MISALLIFAGLFPKPEPTVDLIEINHYQPAGEQRFVQVIAWEWLPDYQVYRVQDWKIIDEWEVDERACRLMFFDNNRRHVIRYKLWRETWTSHDPERDDRQHFAEQYRIKVFR